MDFFFSSSLMFYINQQQQNHSYNASSSSWYHPIKWWKAKNHLPLTQYILEVNKQLKKSKNPMEIKTETNRAWRRVSRNTFRNARGFKGLEKITNKMWER